MTSNIFPFIIDELTRARKKFKPFNSSHEGFAVLLEEVEELKAFVFMKEKNRPYNAMKDECIQIAAMAIRFAEDCCSTDPK